MWRSTRPLHRAKRFKPWRTQISLLPNQRANRRFNIYQAYAVLSFKVHHTWAWNSTINAINEYGGPHIHGMEQKDSIPGAVKYCYRELTQRADRRSNTYPACAALPFKVHHKWAWNSTINAINEDGGPHIHGMELKDSNPGAVKYRYRELTQRPDRHSNTYPFAPLCLSKPTINEPDPPFSMILTGMESTHPWHGAKRFKP